MWKARVEKKNNPGNELWKQEFMKLLKIFMFQRVCGIHICLFCCGSFVHQSCFPPRCAEWDGAAFPSRDPFILGAMAVAPGRTGCPCCQPAGLTAAGFSHPHQFAPQWHKLRASVLSASLCLYTSLCSCLLSAFSVHCRFGPGTFSSFPCFAGRKQTESTASNNSHPCPIHPIENPEQHFQASLHSTSQSWNHTKQAVKIWPFKNNNSVRDRQYYRKIFPIVNFCSGCVMLTRWNLIAKGL